MRYHILAAATCISVAFLSAPALAKGKEREPAPSGNPGEWATPNDYPVEALREEREGVVGFKLEIDAKGIPTKCDVIRPSDSSDLNDTTCRLMMQNARFKPAADKNGRPVAGTWSNAVRWVIPEGTPSTPQVPEPSDITLEYTVEKDGSVSNCTQKPADSPLPICNALLQAHFAPKLGPDGLPQRVHIRQRQTVEVIPAE